MLHVNGSTGDDKAGNGTPERPFKTVGEVLRRQAQGRLPVAHTRIQAIDAHVEKGTRMPGTNKPSREHRRQALRPKKDQIIRHETTHYQKIEVKV